ncbi:MAG: hypothetical protein ACLVBA_17840 [Alistipes finegoldii]|uniref:DUF7688 family protein n=1 Tax=Alistipes finegoldii TaxID=214856 RepID=UPI00399C5E73
MKQEIRQFGETMLWAEGEEYTSIPMIFRNITGRNFTGKEYRAYIENWILHQGFELGPVELWEDGRFQERGEIKLPGKEVHHV